VNDTIEEPELPSVSRMCGKMLTKSMPGTDVRRCRQKPHSARVGASRANGVLEQGMLAKTGVNMQLAIIIVGLVAFSKCRFAYLYGGVHQKECHTLSRGTLEI
jgi:hypothetical protein